MTAGEMISVSSSLMTALAAGAAVSIAWKGLQTWKHQALANRQVDFLDALADSVHLVVASMSKPVYLIEAARIGFASRTQTNEVGTDCDPAGAAQYIREHGEEDSQRMMIALAEGADHVAQLRSLAVKGQVFDFHGYDSCLKACTLIAWQSDRAGAFALMLGSTHSNFDHPIVRRGLENTLELDPAQIRLELEQQSVEVLQFIANNYRSILR